MWIHPRVLLATVRDSEASFVACRANGCSPVWFYLSIFQRNVYSIATIFARCSLLAAPAWPPSVFL